MNYTFDEALDVLEAFLQEKSLPYAVACAWEIVANNRQFTQEEVDESYEAGYSAGTDTANEVEYDRGYEDGYADCESEYRSGQ